MLDKYHDKKDILIEIARLYYLEKKSQQEVAELFNTTRSNVAKLIKQAWDMGLIEITIANPSNNAVRLGNELKERFGLIQAVVVPSRQSEQDTLAAVGQAAAKFLVSAMHDKIRIGVGWGTSLFQMVEYMPKINMPQATVVQLHGGGGSRNLQVDGYELARNLSNKLHCRSYHIQAPLVVRSKELKKLLVKEPHIAETLELSEAVDIAFLGIGTSEPEFSALQRAGFLREAESRQLWREGAVGMICGRYYDIEGRLLPSEVNERVVGLDVKKLRKIPCSAGVACGLQKVDTLIGAMRGKYINTLFTDESAAVQILARSRKE